MDGKKRVSKQRNQDMVQDSLPVENTMAHILKEIGLDLHQCQIVLPSTIAHSEYGSQVVWLQLKNNTDFTLLQNNVFFLPDAS